jgi:hypothetical protein
MDFQTKQLFNVLRKMATKKHSPHTQMHTTNSLITFYPSNMPLLYATNLLYKFPQNNNNTIIEYIIILIQ